MENIEKEILRKLDEIKADLEVIKERLPLNETKDDSK